MTVVAQEAPPAAPVQREAVEPPPCVEVEIGGVRAGDLDCLNRRLRAAADPPAARAVPPVDAQSPGPRLGLANDAAFRQRMGSAYGVSIRPARPAPEVFTPVLPARPR